MSDEEDEKAMRHMFDHAKTNHEKSGGALEPVAFILGADRGLTIVSLVHIWGDGNERDAATDILRDEAKKVRATFISIVSDTWLTRFGPEATERIRADGLNPDDITGWTREQRDRYQPVRREAIMMTMECRSGTKVICQFYRRDCDKVIWEEFCDTEEWTRLQGRLFGLLPRTGARH